MRIRPTCYQHKLLAFNGKRQQGARHRGQCAARRQVHTPPHSPYVLRNAAPHSSTQGQGDEVRDEAPLRSRVRRPRQWLAFDVPRYIRIDRPSKNLNRKVKSLEWDTFLQKRGTIYRRKGRQKGKSHNNGAMPPGGGC